MGTQYCRLFWVGCNNKRHCGGGVRGGELEGDSKRQVVVVVRGWGLLCIC